MAVRRLAMVAATMVGQRRRMVVQCLHTVAEMMVAVRPPRPAAVEHPHTKADVRQEDPVAAIPPEVVEGILLVEVGDVRRAEVEVEDTPAAVTTKQYVN